MAGSDPLDAAKLRKTAARFFRLAASSVDRNTAKAIWDQAAELLDRANEIDGCIDEVAERLKKESRPP